MIQQASAFHHGFCPQAPALTSFNDRSWTGSIRGNKTSPSWVAFGKPIGVYHNIRMKPEHQLWWLILTSIWGCGGDLGCPRDKHTGEGYLGWPLFMLTSLVEGGPLTEHGIILWAGVPDQMRRRKGAECKYSSPSAPKCGCHGTSCLSSSLSWWNMSQNNLFFL